MKKTIAIYRHLVKGLRAEPVTHGVFQPLRGLVGDRAFAFQFLDESVPQELREVAGEDAPWMSKFHLTVQHDWPQLAQIVPSFDEKKKVLKLRYADKTISASVETEKGKNDLAEFIHDFLKQSQPYEKARHPMLANLRFIGKPDLSSRFTDSNNGSVSLATEATFKDLSNKFGFDIDARRFRPNLILSGADAWSELKWSGKKIKIGGCILEALKPLGRCANIDVNPETGERDADIYSKLKPTFGHAMTGIRAEVVQAGEITAGDTWEFI